MKTSEHRVRGDKNEVGVFFKRKDGHVLCVGSVYLPGCCFAVSVAVTHSEPSDVLLAIYSSAVIKMGLRYSKLMKLTHIKKVLKKAEVVDWLRFVSVNDGRGVGILYSSGGRTVTLTCP